MSDDDKPEEGAGSQAKATPAAKPAPAVAAKAVAKPAEKPAEKAEEKTPPDASPIYQRVKAQRPDLLDDGSHIDRGDILLHVKLQRAAELGQLLRDDAELAFDYLCQLTAVDYPERAKRFDVIWTLLSTKRGHLAHVVAAAGDGEDAPTVGTVWPTAGWHERECYDMFGIRFAGNPDQRRILLPEWWEGFPLRKDYPTEGRGEHERVVEECLRPRI